MSYLVNMRDSMRRLPLDPKLATKFPISNDELRNVKSDLENLINNNPPVGEFFTGGLYQEEKTLIESLIAHLSSNCQYTTMDQYSQYDMNELKDKLTSKFNMLDGRTRFLGIKFNELYQQNSQLPGKIQTVINETDAVKRQEKFVKTSYEIATNIAQAMIAFLQMPQQVSA